MEERRRRETKSKKKLTVLEPETDLARFAEAVRAAFSASRTWICKQGDARDCQLFLPRKKVESQNLVLNSL